MTQIAALWVCTCGHSNLLVGIYHFWISSVFEDERQMSDLSNFRTQVRSVPHKKDAVLIWAKQLCF